jgi:Ca2+-binding RTX toxin-like protein
LVLNPDGSFTYRADHADDLIAGEKATDVFSYVARNAAGEEATAKLSITIAGADEKKTGGAGDDVLMGGRGADTLTGGPGNDWLDGGPGADFLFGGTGNDTFLVDMFGDQIIETGGTDTVQTATGYALQKGLAVEMMKAASGFAGVTLRGNEFRQKIFGGLGNDILSGGGGNDTLTGGSGRDSFVFDLRKGGTDTLVDFKVGQDKIQLSGKAFGLKKGALKSGAFAKVHGFPNAAQSDDRVFYDRSKGFVYVDWDGAGSKAPALVAILKTKPNLLAKDFFVI